MSSDDEDGRSATEYRKKKDTDALQQSGAAHGNADQIDYLDEQLNMIGQQEEFKLSDLNNDFEVPSRDHDAVNRVKMDEEEDLNSLEARLKNIRKNLNFEGPTLHEMNENNKNEEKDNEANRQEPAAGKDSLKDKYKSFISNLQIRNPDQETNAQHLD